MTKTRSHNAICAQADSVIYYYLLHMGNGTQDLIALIMTRIVSLLYYSMSQTHMTERMEMEI